MNAQHHDNNFTPNTIQSSDMTAINMFSNHNKCVVPAEKIATKIAQHCVLEAEQIDAIVLWLISSYMIDSFRIFPKLAFISPEKRCGKTTTMEIAHAFAKDGLLVSNISGAAIYRMTEKYKPTLFIDEADTFLKNGDTELVGLINSSHTKAGANVVRCVGENYHAKTFSTWIPMVLASIGDLPPTLMDRSVVINLRRKKSNEFRNPIPVDLLDQESQIRDQLLSWCASNASSIKGAMVSPPKVDNDRAEDNWIPLFSVAHAIGGDWPERAERAYRKLTVISELELPTRLLMAIRDYFIVSGNNRIQTNDLVRELCSDSNGPWLECNNGKKLTGNQIARLLRPYGIEPGTHRFDNKIRRGYLKGDFDDAFERYLP